MILKNLVLDEYDYSAWSKKEESANKGESNDKEELTVKEESEDLPQMLPDEEVKEGRRLKIFDSKQITNQTCNIISTNKGWKQFIQIKQ